MKYKYTNEAVEFIKILQKFNLDEFEKWVDGLVLNIGSTNVIQYLDEKNRWNTECVLNGSLLRCDFSQQAKNVIRQVKDFDANECKIWFSNALRLSKNDIINYLDSMGMK